MQMSLTVSRMPASSIFFKIYRGKFEQRNPRLKHEFCKNWNCVSASLAIQRDIEMSMYCWMHWEANSNCFGCLCITVWMFEEVDTWCYTEFWHFCQSCTVHFHWVLPWFQSKIFSGFRVIKQNVTKSALNRLRCKKCESYINKNNDIEFSMVELVTDISALIIEYY